MSPLHAIASQSEIKTRKHWLFATLSYLIVGRFVALPFIMLLSMKEIDPTAVLIGTIMAVILSIIPMLVIWHCTYRKFGTKLLTVWLVLCLTDLFKIFLCAAPGWPKAVFILDVLVFIWWYVLSLKVRAINKRIRKRFASASLSTED